MKTLDLKKRRFAALFRGLFFGFLWFCFLFFLWFCYFGSLVLRILDFYLSSFLLGTFAHSHQGRFGLNPGQRIIVFGYLLQSLNGSVVLQLTD